MDESKKQRAEEIKRNKELLKKYPILKPRLVNANDVGAKYDYSYTELDFVCIGWQKMFLETCDEIMAHIKEIGMDPKEFWFYDIKEKWGQLRISVGGYSDEAIDDILNRCEIRSMLYCPHCGKPTKYVTSGYVLYLCPDCVKEARLNGELLTEKDVPYYTEYRYDDKGNYTKEIKRSAYDAQFRAQWNGKE